MRGFRYPNRMHPLKELSGYLSNTLCFAIYISLRNNPKYGKLSSITTVFPPQKLIKRGVRKSESVQGSQVAYPGLWIMKFWILCSGSRVLDSHFRLCQRILNKKTSSFAQ